MIQGKCNICGGMFSDKGIARHIKTCIKNKYGVKSIDTITSDCTLLIKVQGKYESQHFLFLLIDNCVLLRELDEYLRDIWLECCGHLSSFEIDGEQYDSHVDSSSDQDMLVEVGEILFEERDLSYTYDLGSPTELKLKVIDIFEPVSKDKGIRLTARNQMPVYECNYCENNAQFLFTNYDDGAQGIVCSYCKKKMEVKYDDICFNDMPNSPRMGVCGYEGPADDIMFMRHKQVSKGKKRKNNIDQKDDDRKTLFDKLVSGNITEDELSKYTEYQEALAKIKQMTSSHLYSQQLPPFMIDGNKLAGINLIDCLRGLRKSELDVVRKSLSITNASGMKKNELVNLLNDYIVGNIDEILAAITYPEYEEIIGISEVEGPFIKQPDDSEEVPDTIDELRTRGLLFTIFNYSDRCGLFIPDDIKKVITRLSRDSSFKARRNLTRKINETLLAIFYYWGVVEKPLLIKETARLLELPADDSFTEVFDKVFEFMCTSFVASERVGSVQYYYIFSAEPAEQVISNSWKNSSYPVITREMMEPAKDGQIGLILDNPYYLDLYELMREAEIDKDEGGEEQLLDTITLLAETLVNERPGVTAREIAKDLGFEIDLRKAPVIEELINNMIRYTPNYWIRGNTLSGRMLYGARCIKDAGTNGNSGSSIKADKKSASGKAADRWNVGRNDLCPCGSGKKYKMCCMKK